MKMLRTLLLMVMLCIAGSIGLHAQAGGGASGPPGSPVQCACDLVNGDVSTGCYSTKNGLGNNPWSMSLVVDILRPARNHFNLSLGQMIQRYHDCGCVITYLGDGWFRVSIGGGDTLIVITNID